VLEEILTDLGREGDQLWNAVAGLDADGWATPTPATGWTVATSVAHLLWTDEVAVLAAAAGAGTPDGQERWAGVVRAAIEDPLGYIDAQAHEVARLAPEALLARWGKAREELARALREHPAGEKLPWFGPPMSPASMATARLMETWAHALDVYDALGVEPERTDRIRHVAHLGVRTRGFAFTVHDLPVPPDEPRVELVAPSGAVWTWGPEGAAQSVAGSAWDFCLLVTQRMHRADTDLVATGADADRWLDIAQAFAGMPGEGRQPRG
jgi:uncharacterized protein (TIGR03084 family)